MKDLLEKGVRQTAWRKRRSQRNTSGRANTLRQKRCIDLIDGKIDSMYRHELAKIASVIVCRVYVCTLKAQTIHMCACWRKQLSVNGDDAAGMGQNPGLIARDGCAEECTNMYATTNISLPL